MKTLIALLLLSTAAFAQNCMTVEQDEAEAAAAGYTAHFEMYDKHTNSGLDLDIIIVRADPAEPDDAVIVGVKNGCVLGRQQVNINQLETFINSLTDRRDKPQL